MANDLAKLNRLRVNAGKPELKSWKASAAKLNEAISRLETDGFLDVLPGANLDAAPKTDDPEVAAARPVEEKEDFVPPPLSESALSKNIDTSAKKPKVEPTTTKGRASLARGLDTDLYARHSRERVRDEREREKKDKKKLKLTPEDQKQIKDEAEKRLPKGQVDPKKDPDKAKRQADKIEAKRKKREAEGKVSKPKEKNADEVTVADLARDLKIDPKVARAKLRRYEGKDGYPKPIKGERWTFPKSDSAALKKILTGAK